MEIANALVTFAGIYLWVGVATAVLFLGWGVDRIDPSARGAYLFRLLVAPGVIGLWPLVAVRWAIAESRIDRRGAGHAG
ncbi:hypothetical protein BAL199_29897 [alpha proteobacterium BAL199]|jgi:hypothetical protein|nr:hypothetical protein BAL199_29897 [alpha proteobacterium BAL199]